MVQMNQREVVLGAKVEKRQKIIKKIEIKNMQNPLQMMHTDGGTGTTDAVAVLDFGGDKTATSGTFTIQFPAFTTSAAILRIS